MKVFEAKTLKQCSYYIFLHSRIEEYTIMIGTIVNYIRIQRLLNKIIESEKLEKNLSRLFGVDCRRDWVGRLYMVVNPIIQDIEDGGNTIVYDKDENLVIEGWIMKNLELIRNFVVNNSLFDLMTYNIEKLDDDDNYLIVFKNVYFDSMKRIIKWSSIMVLLGLLVWGGFLIF